MKLRIGLCVLLMFGCSKKPDAPSAEELADLEKQKAEQNTQEKEKYRLESLQKENQRKVKALKKVKADLEAFENKHAGYKMLIQINRVPWRIDSPEATNFKDYIGKLN